MNLGAFGWIVVSQLPTTGNWLIDRAAQFTPRSGYGCPLMRNIKI
jgi:hypothetical protein